MKTLSKVLPAVGLAVSVGYASAAAAVDFTGNIGATSNYVWRGLTQNDNEAAISGGLDLGTDLGLYAGTWVSSLGGGGEEVDVYAGYAKTFGPVDFDIGAIRYMYPLYSTKDDPLTPNLDEGDINWNEGYVSVGSTFGIVSPKLMVSYTNDFAGTEESAMYIEVNADVAVSEKLTVGLHVGNYNFDADDPADTQKNFSGYEDYTDYSVSLSSGEFTFTVSDVNLESDSAKGLDYSADKNTKFFVSWAKEFDLLK